MFRRMHHTMGRRNFLGFLIFLVFIVFFFTPILNLIMLAFADTYHYPRFIPPWFSFKWWEYVLSQDNLAKAILTSFTLAIITTIISLIICIPAAYAFARYDFPGRRFFLFSFLISNAFPKIGLYVMIGVALQQEFSVFNNYQRAAALSTVMFILSSIVGFAYISSIMKEDKWN